MQMSYLYASDFPLKNFCSLAHHAETIRRNVLEKINDALSIGVETTINRISIFFNVFMFFFYDNIEVKENVFFQSAS